MQIEIKKYIYLKFKWFLLISSFLFASIYGCTLNQDKIENIETVSEEKCYLLVNSNNSKENSFLYSISKTLITQYHEEVISMPSEGIKEGDCFYEVSLSRSNSEVTIDISGKNLNGMGESNLQDNKGIKQALLSALYKSLASKRSVICKDYGELIDDCIKDNLIASKKKTVIGILYAESNTVSWIKNGRKWYREGHDMMARYEGEIKNNVPHGLGKEIFPDGKNYEGTFNNGRRVEGSEEMSNGDLYVGQFHDRCPNGYGTLRFKSGRKYTGSFKKCFYDGKGTLNLENGYAYSGLFKANVYHGEGTLKMPNGTKFVGIWREGKPWNIDVHEPSGQIWTNFYINGREQ